MRPADHGSQPELMAIAAAVNGVMPVIGRNTVDSAHNSGYAAGYLFNKVKPRMAMTTHIRLRRLLNRVACRDPLPLRKFPFWRARHGGGN
jgi:hypothetical protein